MRQGARLSDHKMQPAGVRRSTPQLVSQEQNVEHPSHPDRQMTGTIIHDSGARFRAADSQRSERLYGHVDNLHTALEYRFNDVQLLPLLAGIWFLYKSKHTQEHKLAVIVGCSHSPPMLIYRAQGGTKKHSSPVHDILYCVGQLEDCPVDMQGQLRRYAEIADEKMHDEQMVKLQQQADQLKDIRHSKADAASPINLAVALEDASSDGEQEIKASITAGKGKGKKAPAKSKPGAKQGKEQTCSSDEDNDGDSDASSASSEQEDDDQPRDEHGQRRFGRPPVSQAELMKSANLHKAEGWVGLTVCTSVSPLVIGILSSCNTRRVPPMFKYRTVGGKCAHSLSLASTAKAINQFQDLPEQLKPGSKASEAVEVTLELKQCPKKLIKMFGEVHQAAIVAADKASANGTLVCLRSFTDPGKAVAFMQVLVQLSESDAQLLACASPLTIGINKAMEVKNLMFSSMECFNWSFLKFDVHALESLCARQHHNPRTPNPATSLGINSYHRTKQLSIEVIKDALETLAAMLTVVYGFQLAMKMRLSLMAAVDEARQLMPDAAVAAANVAISYCLRHTSERISSAMSNWLPQSGANPIDSFSWTGDWNEVKMLKLLPLARGTMGGAQRPNNATLAANRFESANSLDSLWDKPPLHDYKPGPKLVAHAKEWCRTCGTTYVDWSTTIKAWDRVQGTKYGSHKHQRKCFLRYGFSPGRCLGHTKCSRCFVEVQWNKGVKSKAG